MNPRRLLYLIAFLGVSVYILCFVTSFVTSYVRKDDWRQKTSPLPKATVIDLCEKLILASSDSLCDGSHDVYAPDFSRAIDDRFPLDGPMETPKSKATISYDDIQNVLGEYKQRCEDVVHLSVSNYSYFRCFYDLRGDGYWIAAFYFYSSEKTLFSIRTGSHDD